MAAFSDEERDLNYKNPAVSKRLRDDRNLPYSPPHAKHERVDEDFLAARTFHRLMSAPQRAGGPSAPACSSNSAPATVCSACTKVAVDARLVLCSFCDRAACQGCASPCGRCGSTFCLLCSISINGEVLCFDCRDTFFPSSQGTSSSSSASPSSSTPSSRRGFTTEQWDFTPDSVRDDESVPSSQTRQPTLEFFWRH